MKCEQVRLSPAYIYLLLSRRGLSLRRVVVVIVFSPHLVIARMCGVGCFQGERKGLGVPRVLIEGERERARETEVGVEGEREKER